MNEKLSRSQFNQWKSTEKQALMECLAARYDMAFLGLHTFDRWGQSCTTGVFERDGREFVFVPATPSPWAGITSPWGWVPTAGRSWTICFGNGRWSRGTRRS